MLNKTYKTVWNRSTLTYIAASEAAKFRGAKGASACGALVAGAGLLSTLVYALPASAAGSIDQYIAVSTTLTEGSEPTSVDNTKLNAMALGPNAVSNGNNALAVGAKTLASLDGTTAVGSAAAALAVNATVIGAGATTGGDALNGVAIGYMASAEGVNTLGLGAHASALGDDSIALGTNASTSDGVAKTIAIGSGASASAAGGIALGAGSRADRANALSVGNSSLNRQIINVAAGTQNSDVVNVSQLKGAMEAIGGGATVNVDGTIRKPMYMIGGQTYADVGAALSALVTSTETASADWVRYDSTSHDAVTLGNTGTPAQLTNVRAGALAADSSDAVNGSQLFATNQAVAQNTSDIAANTGSITNLDARTTTIEGDVSNITNQITNGEIGLVQQDQVSRNLTVAKDLDGASVDFTGSGGARELTGIAAGTTDTSAVSLGQLKPVVAALGGGAQINADGSLTGPTYHMQGGTQGNVGDALGSLDSGLTTLQQNMQTGGIGIVTQDPVSRIINVGATTDGDLINVAGTAGNRLVTGVAPGAVNAASTDAINGSQLYTHAASTAVALGGGSTVNPDGSVTAPSYSVGGTVVNNVGSAISNLDGRVTQNTSDIAGLQTTIGNISGSVANAVQYDSSAHDKVTLGGTAATTPRVTLTNLQDGEVSATSTDAVTGAQLWNTNQQIGNLGQQIGDLGQAVKNTQVTGSSYVAVNSSGNAAQAIGNGTVAIGGGAKASAPNSVAIGEGSVADQSNTVSVGATGNERRITNVAAGQAPGDAVNMQQFQGGMSDMARNAYSGTASAIALTMVPEVDANKNLAIGVGTAGYKGYQAVAVGLSARVTQSLKVKLGAGISSATTTVGAGAAYQW